MRLCAYRVNAGTSTEGGELFAAPAVADDMCDLTWTLVKINIYRLR